MILQALCEYYDRKAALGEMPPYGREWKPIPYLIVINKDGDFMRLESTLEGEGKDKRPKKFLLSLSRGRSGSKSWETANRLWDHYGYVFGFPKKMDFDNDKMVETGQLQNQAFQKELHQLSTLNPDDESLKAVLRFYDKMDLNIEKLAKDPLYEEAMKKDGTNFGFRLLSETEPVGSRLDFNYGDEDGDSPTGLCLVTGKHEGIAILNNAISLRNANASGAKLVGFQKNSGYDSYHKEQGMNAPISERANYAYTTALNTLISPKSKNKFFFNKDTMIFWAAKDNAFEDLFSIFFASLPKDNPDANVERISALMKAPLAGSLSDDDTTRFYLLLLSPNNKRIAVKLWEENTVKNMAVNIRKYFSDLEIVRSSSDKEYLPLGNLLRSISLQNKEENLPPQLFSSMMRAILEGLPFPQLLQTQTLARIRADRIVSRNRAALIKAYLNRKRNNYNEKTITMSLDPNNDNQAYLCGRLFAIFEKIQQMANPGVNSSIRDQYFDSFSCTPNVALARLSALSNHHMQKLSRGSQVYYERLKGEVMDRLHADGLPSHFSLDDQSRFMIGYYQQRQALFKSNNNNDTETNNSQEK
ncbi:MAG: type I-C CRISPR-associated protein Cas8c/Csd1 [Prevotella sp.]|jgi:CRISPR-associated protein Csd1